MPVKQITPPQANEIMQKDVQVIYLDVRTVPEFTNGHPQRGLNIPAFFFQAPGQPIPNPDFLKVVEANIPKDATVIVGCQAGGRSQRAAEMMAQAGYHERFQHAGRVWWWTRSDRPCSNRMERFRVAGQH